MSTELTVFDVTEPKNHYIAEMFSNTMNKTITKDDFEVVSILPHVDENPFYNTAIVIKSKDESIIRSGEYYYHRNNLSTNKIILDSLLAFPELVRVGNKNHSSGIIENRYEVAKRGLVSDLTTIGKQLVKIGDDWKEVYSYFYDIQPEVIVGAADRNYKTPELGEDVYEGFFWLLNGDETQHPYYCGKVYIDATLDFLLTEV